MKPKRSTLSLLLLSTLLVSVTAQADTSEDDKLFLQEQEVLVEKINELENQLEAHKSQQWNTEVILSNEMEIDSTDNWKFIDGSMANSPAITAFMSQTGSKFIYDVQYLKTWIDHKENYERARFSIGATYLEPYTFLGKKGTYGLRLGWRNDVYHYDLGNPKPGIDRRIAEERDEFWIKPILNYTYSPQLSFMSSFTFRPMKRDLEYAGTIHGPETKRTKDWSMIQEHLIGSRYTFENGNTLTGYYLFVRDNLVRTLDNEEHFLWVNYSMQMPWDMKFAPYTRYAIIDAKHKFYNSDNELTAYKTKDRTRWGFQVHKKFNNQQRIMLDVYYRPEKTTYEGVTTENNFFLVVLEYYHKF